MVSNKKLGSGFEQELAEFLHGHGYWVHLLTQNASGQPADIIACKCDQTFLIDAKVCSRGRFDLDRVEENQDRAMHLFESCTDFTGLFAFKVDDEIRFVYYDDIVDEIYAGRKSLSKEDILNALTFEELEVEFEL